MTKLNITQPFPEEADSMILCEKFSFDAYFFETITDRVVEIGPHLVKHAFYTAIDLIGEPLWADLTELAQRQAIACLKHMASQPGSMLVDATGGDFAPSLFQLQVVDAFDTK